MTDLSIPQRQSVIAVVFLAFRIIRSFGITQLALVAFFIIRGAADGRLVAVGTVAIGILGATSLLAWWRYTFQLLGRELVVTRGILRVDRLTVPFDRIQSVSIDQELLHRATGLVKVTVDTAGSGNAELTIDAIDRGVATELQRQALTARSAIAISRAAPSGSDALSAEERIVFRHDWRRLLLTALTSPPWTALVILGPIVAFAGQFGDELETAPTVDPGPFRWWWVAVGAGALLAVSLVLNLINVFVQHWDLTVRSGPSILRRTSGLLSRTSRASSPTRVQIMTTDQNPLQHAAGIRTVGLSSIGDGDLALIGCDDHQVDVVHHLVEVSSPAAAPLDRRIERSEIWLAVRNTTIFMAAAAAAAWFVVGWWSLLALVVVPVVWVTTARHVRTFRWSIGDELATRRHVLMRSTQQALLRKANAVRITQSIFERRRGLGRLHLDTAAGTVSIGMIPIDTARAVRDVVLHAAESDRRPWM